VRFVSIIDVRFGPASSTAMWLHHTFVALQYRHEVALRRRTSTGRNEEELSHGKRGSAFVWRADVHVGGAVVSTPGGDHGRVLSTRPEQLVGRRVERAKAALPPPGRLCL
jgi:hypothetical protein